MKQITRNIDFDAARDLLERVPRACICFAHESRPHSQPVTVVWREKRYFVGIPESADCQPNSGQEVVLLVDEGVYFFDLRAIYIRGHLQPAETPMNAASGYLWCELIPIKTVAWDYGTLREVHDES